MTLTSVIRPGDTLIIPAGSTTPVPASPAAVPAASPATTAAPAGSPTTTYVVKPGDALAGIARLNGVKLGALLKANNLKATSVIMPGQTLKVPPATMPIPAPRVATTTTTTPVAPAAAVQAIANVTTPAPAATPTSTPGDSLGTVLTFLRAQVGVPYAFFRAGPDAYDCSGLVVAAFRQVGVNLPHQSRALAQRGTPVDWTTSPITAGDLVFTSVVGDPTMITHVGIALDATTWIHAVGVGRSVSIGSLPPASKIMTVRRIALP
jgi:cell wall-associated NlpC family hydrolase